MTAAYTAAGAVIPAGAHGAGFGVLTSASLVGMASSPFIGGFLGGDVDPRRVRARRRRARCAGRRGDRSTTRDDQDSQRCRRRAYADDEPVVSETL